MGRRGVAWGLMAIAALCAAEASAESGAVNVHLEPGAAVMVGAPQTTAFGYGFGFAGALKGDVKLFGPVAVELGLSSLVFPTRVLESPGVAVTGSLGVRVRLLDDVAGYLLHLGSEGGHRGNAFGNLWIDVLALAVGTGSLLRPGLEAGAGVELSLADGISIGPFVRYVHVFQTREQFQTPGDAHVVLVGLSLSFAVPSNAVHVPDSDGDGVPDDVDACGQLAGPPSELAGKNGCPPDTDADGVPDARDACPVQAGVQSDDPRLNGCPRDSDADGISDAKDDCPLQAGVESDRDGHHGCPADHDDDGIPDAVDACAKLPGITSDDPKKHGCPQDTDSDRIADVNDACPLQPGVASTIAALNGCPPDSDSDGVPDTTDACPNKMGPQSPDPKKNGCPDAKVKAFVTPEKIIITERVFFEFNKYRILPKSYPLLDTVAYLLKKHDELKKLFVDGHTDDVGSADSNLALSEKRAQAVLAYLVKQGVDPSRLVARGFGKTKPLVPGDSEAAREVNRRVEFVISERSDLFPAQPP